MKALGYTAIVAALAVLAVLGLHADGEKYGQAIGDVIFGGLLLILAFGWLVRAWFEA